MDNFGVEINKLNIDRYSFYNGDKIYIEFNCGFEDVYIIEIYDECKEKYVMRDYGDSFWMFDIKNIKKIKDLSSLNESEIDLLNNLISKRNEFFIIDHDQAMKEIWNNEVDEDYLYDLFFAEEIFHEVDRLNGLI